MRNGKPRGIVKQAAVIITGASTGIGRALAVELARRFACRMVLNARSAEALAATALQVEEAGGVAVAVDGDVADRKVTAKLAHTCLDRFGRVDMVVNNAGLAISGAMQKLSVDDWHRVFDVNFFGALHLTYEILPHLMERRAGKIVNVASVAGKIAFPGSVCYAASKFALTGLSEGMAAELSSKGIDVITVCPGWVRTEFFEKNKLSADPTRIARQNDVKGWLMRNVLSISSEECARDIIKACQRGGSHELVLTKPGVVLERLSGLAPDLVFRLSRMVPSKR